jgi:hypothetical protein
MKHLTIAFVLFAAACGKSSDATQPAAKPAEAVPAKPVPAKPAPTAAARPKPVTPPPASAAPATGKATQADRDLVASIAPDKSQLTWTTPSGEHVKVEARKRIVKDAFVVDLVVDGRVLETVQTGAEKPDENGFSHYEPKAYVGPIPQGVLFVGGTSKITGKPDEQFDARVLTWDKASQQLVIARKIQFEDLYDPSTGGIMEK